jgi:hypothetical protein
MAGGQTPDFKMDKDGTLRGYCEIKSPRDDWIFEQFANVPQGSLSGTIVGGARPDPTFNNLARQIERAAP